MTVSYYRRGSNNGFLAFARRRHSFALRRLDGVTGGHTSIHGVGHGPSAEESLCISTHRCSVRGVNGSQCRSAKEHSLVLGTASLDWNPRSPDKFIPRQRGI